MVRPPVVDPGSSDLHRAGAHRHLPRAGMTVAHHQCTAVLSAFRAVSLHILGDFHLQGLHQHPASPLAQEFVERHRGLLEASLGN